MHIVDMPDSETYLSRLIETVESGVEREIIIVRNGKPAARLVPIEAKPEFGKRIGLLEGQFSSMSLEDFDADNDEIAALFYGETE